LLKQEIKAFKMSGLGFVGPSGVANNACLFHGCGLKKFVANGYLKAELVVSLIYFSGVWKSFILSPIFSPPIEAVAIDPFFDCVFLFLYSCWHFLVEVSNSIPQHIHLWSVSAGRPGRLIFICAQIN
jgi:hypothetical protein